MEQIKFEARDGNTYVLVTMKGGPDCAGCAFEHDSDACEAAAMDCLFPNEKGEMPVWVLA